MRSIKFITQRAVQILLLTLVAALCFGAATLSAQEQTPSEPESPTVDEYGVPLEASIVSQVQTPEGVRTITEIPVQMDSFVTSGIPEGQPPVAFTNYGNRTDLRLGYRTADGFGAQRIYLLFNVAGAGIPSNATINSAIFRIWTSDAAGDMGFEARHLSSSWNEFSVTWMNNRPQWGGSLGTGVITAGAGEKTGSATNLVRDWVTGAHPNNGVIIIGNEGTAAPFERVFHSREAANGLFARLRVDWTVTVDTVPPESTITQLPQFSRADFTVAWSGIDLGSPATGIAFWDVDFSIDGVNWSPWLRGTTAQSANWLNSTDGVPYFFRVRAVDNAGNAESFTRNPAQQQTSTTADTVPPITSFQTLPQFTYDAGFPITWTGADNRSGVRQYAVQFNVNGGPWQAGQVFQLGDGQHTRFVTGAVNGETYGFRVQATDQVGNVGPWSNETFTTVYTTPPYPNAQVLQFVPPNHIAGPPGISNDTTFRVTWAIEVAPGTAVVDETNVFYSCDGGPWTAWLTNASGTFADFNSTANTVGCGAGDIHIYRFEAVGKALYPGNVTRIEQFRQQAEASVVVDPNETIQIAAYFPVIAGGQQAVTTNQVPLVVQPDEGD
ncbi:MAG: DNRLRE domain-containing protein [Chloroflexi bacterium]|nr:DNRLRE domain-containing protein [Chloroflexota bacterium]